MNLSQLEYLDNATVDLEGAGRHHKGRRRKRKWHHRPKRYVWKYTFKWGHKTYTWKHVFKW